MSAPERLASLSAPPRPLAAQLAAWRAARAGGDHHLDDGCAIILFGVGLETLQRIERGEVEPDDALAERIGRVINSHSAAAVSAAVSPDVVPSGGVGGADDFPPVCVRAASPPSTAPLPGGFTERPAFWLARGDAAAGGAAGFHIEMLLDGNVFVLSQDAARQMICDLWPLLAVAAQPDLYDHQSRGG